MTPIRNAESSSDRGPTIVGADAVDAPRRLPDGTIVQFGRSGWERYPRSEIGRLREQGYCVWDLGEEADYCAVIYALWMRRSADGGKSWQEFAVHEQLPSFARLYAPYSPMVLDDGSLACFVYGHRSRSERMSSYYLRTTDAGETWSITMIGNGEDSPADDATYAHIDSRAGFGEIRAIRLGDGKLFAMLRSQLGMPTFVVTSDDFGQTWTPPRETPLVAKHVHPTHLSTRAVLCTYQRRFAPPYGVRARITTDLGASWSEEIIIRDDIPIADGLSEPHTFELADGSLFSAFFAYRVIDGAKRSFVGATRWSLPPMRVAGESQWTRGDRWVPDIPVPPAQPMFNSDARGRSPWAGE